MRNDKIIEKNSNSASKNSLLEGVRIGFVFTGAFYMLKKITPQIQKLINGGAIIIPIMPKSIYESNQKDIKEFSNKIEDITKNKIIHTIAEIEPIGRKDMTDIILIAPCTRKHNIKISFRHNRYGCNSNCKISF